GSLAMKRCRSPSSAYCSAFLKTCRGFGLPTRAAANASRSIAGTAALGALLDAGATMSAAPVGGPDAQDLIAGFSDQYRVFPLRRQRMIFGDDRPAVGQKFHVALAGIDHRLDGDRHARNELETAARFAVVQDLGIFVKAATDAVAAVLADDGEAVFLDEAL